MKKGIELINSIINKDKKLIIGILSGTSVDAVDVVLTEVEESGTSTKVSVLNFDSFPISTEIKDYVLKSSNKDTGTVEDVCKLNFLIGNLFADSVNKFLSKHGIKNKDVDLIGSHGQTIYHIPAEEELHGYPIRSTLQVGDPSVIANKTGIVTIGDFRTADMALGGQGAPLVPYLDFVLFRSSDMTRLLINIGGISNVTYLPKSIDSESRDSKNSGINSITAFDTGPGNMVIDSLMKEFYDKTYDEDGATAANGKLQQKLLDDILKFDNYYNRNPPKSTGREFYGESFIEYILSIAHGVSDEDVIRTVTDYTAYTIHYGVSEFINGKPDEILVSGGGANNKFLMGLIKDYFIDADVKPLAQDGINSENKEAVLFAVLANETIHGNPANVPSVSGAERSTILGKICLV
jgi:anhydro-N-acetylmuramic acid kinase